MKKITILLFIVFFTELTYSQGTDILSAEQFCSGTTQLTFNNVYGGSNATSVGCLGSIPNAAYFYLQIDQPGDLIFSIDQQNMGGTPIDVDFIAWGPFTDLNDANSNISFTDCPTCPNNTANPAFYPYAPDFISDCSFSFAPSETMHILNAQQGEIYVVLITNYNGAQGTIDFQQTGGNGTTTCANLPICGSNFYDSGGTTGGYTSNESNTTTINPYFSGGTVTVDFTYFDVPTGDVLTVYNGPDATYPVLGTVTGAPATFTSTTAANPTGALTFEFTSNNSNNGNGWEADITCTAPSTPPTCGATFYDSGGASGTYSNNEFQTYTYYPDTPGDAVTATFTSFDLESGWDYLYVYDGPNTASPSLGTFTGNGTPGPFTSSDVSGALTFVFNSDGSNVSAGWAANLTCGPYVAPPVCGSTFYDSGGTGGNYANNELSTTTFVPDVAGTSVTVTFTTFNTESGYDELYVYDGPDATYPSLGVYSGTSIPGPFTATNASGALTFVFDSDGSFTYSGWSANVTCTNPCNVNITDTVYPLGANDCSLDYTQLVATTNAGPSQVDIYTENFNNGTFPAGWSAINGAPGTDWIMSNTNNAGGTANEAMLDWSTGGSYNTWSLSSPSISIAGYSNLQLSFKHNLWQFGTDFSIFLETSLDGTTWSTQYTVANPPDITETRNVDLSTLDGNTTLYLRFRFTGDSFDLFHWAIDDIVIRANGSGTPQITWSPNTGLYTDSGLTTAYTGGFTDTVYAAPNGSQTYTATDQNSCTNTVTITHNKKVWNGSVDTNWYIAANWTPNGVPSSTNCVVIPDPVNSNNLSPIADVSYLLGIPLPPQPAYALNLTIESNGYLEVKSNTFIDVTDWVHTDPTGTFLLRDSASLIQDPTSTLNSNTGNIHVQRSTSSLNYYDYVYWSSPVADFDVEQISPITAASYIFKWLPTQTVSGGIGNHGDWRNPNPNELMPNGVGYIIRDLGGASLIPEVPALPATTTEFRGVPNNGTITVPISRGTHLITDGTYTGDNGVANGTTHLDDNWNLIGNPYPSAIHYPTFIAANPLIDGTIYLWTHQTAPSAIASPFYENFVYNYSDDYIDNNYTGSNPPGFNNYIASGQAFFVQMLDNASTSEVVTFTNTMRNSTQNNNSQFYRQSANNASDSDNTSTMERHRIWLDLINNDDQATSLLVGYVEGATNEKDRLYDGYYFMGTDMGFYSLINTEKMSIQGRTLPFIDSDTVPLGIQIPQSGTYTIAINTIDGLFELTDQTIYIEDLYTNSIHNIRISPYTFTSEIGSYNDRFILRYTDDALHIGAPDNEELITIATPNNEHIEVTSNGSLIDTVQLFDILGRVIFQKKNINRIDFVYSQPHLANGTYIIKVVLTNGIQKIQKVVLKQ